MKPQWWEKKGRAYWFVVNTLRGCWSLVQRYPLRTGAVTVLLLVALFMTRPLLQPGLVFLRKYLFFMLLAVLLSAWLIRELKRGLLPRRLLVGSGALAVVALLWQWGGGWLNYLTLYANYRDLELIQFEQLPLSDHERIQPLNSIYSLAHEGMTDSQAPMPPNFVRVNDRYHWTLAIEPAYPISRFFGGVTEILSAPATAPVPSFSGESRVPVSFQVGEQLLWGRNSAVAVRRSFGWRRLLNYEPGTISYLTDDQGEWVQVVTLIRWRGFLLPRPAFGGVQLIRQEKNSVPNTLRRVLLGSGEWIKPADISKYKFLKGQNILSYEVSRFMANSFRFQDGFWAPLPGYHRGDVRIPDLPEDVNDQPFTGFFRLDSTDTGALYQYFGLEPYDADKQGLSTSLFVPADGTPRVYVYKHQKQGGTLTGVSAISAKVMESRKTYDWSRNRPVEHRPFIRDIGGRRRFFWLTTVVTFKESSDSRRFIAGTLPEVVLTDAEYNMPVWVDPSRPAAWPEQVMAALAELWQDG